MHTIKVSIQGDVSVEESVEVEDAQALPLFISLKALIKSDETPKPARRRGRPKGSKNSSIDPESESIPEVEGAADDIQED